MHARWGILFSHPADFTPVCTTELSVVVKLLPEFTKRNVKVIALSCEDVEKHKAWIPDVQVCNFFQLLLHFQSLAESTGAFPYPIIADPKRDLAVQFGMIDPDEQDAAGLPLAARAVCYALLILTNIQVFIIGPDKRLKLSILYPATTGRNFTSASPCALSLILEGRFSA
jgi:1-Cys peroxiredoxin 6